MTKHTNVALFVVHEGCPNMCSFCNQRSISGQTKRVTADDVHLACETALNGRESVEGGEIAFFGGSFTMIERSYMLSLLSAAKEHIDKGEFSGIRISTRPDGISDEICGILKAYGVSSVELGAQSMSDNVLLLNRRGHTAQDVVNASVMLKSYGFSLGLQMMTGLYGSTDADSIESAEKIIALKPDTVRIYPTVVLEGTELDRLMKSGKYVPQTPEQAAELGSELIPMFNAAGIKIIRFGLHSGGDVQGNMTGGAFHPALREMAESRIYFKSVLASLSGRQGSALIRVNPRCVSKMAGQKKENITRLRELGVFCKIVPDERLDEYDTEIEFSGE